MDGDAEHLMGYCNLLALNADDDPRIAYFDASNQDLRHISYLLIGWGVPVIVDDNLGSTCDITLALDGEGYSHILYHKGDTSDSLRYVRQQSGSGWSFETVDGSATNCGMDIAQALDSLGRPHAIYSFNQQASSCLSPIAHTVQDGVQKSTWRSYLAAAGITEQP